MRPNGKCAICGESYGHFGHNPEPLGDHDARVCDRCNASLVIPARLGQLTDAQVARIRGLTETPPSKWRSRS
jgi:hypothetical protein